MSYKGNRPLQDRYVGCVPQRGSRIVRTLAHDAEFLHQIFLPIIDLRRHQKDSAIRRLEDASGISCTLDYSETEVSCYRLRGAKYEIRNPSRFRHFALEKGQEVILPELEDLPGLVSRIEPGSLPYYILQHRLEYGL